MNLRGVKSIENGPKGRYRIAANWSRCYWGRYNKGSRKCAIFLTGRTKLWARYANKKRKPIHG